MVNFEATIQLLQDKRCELLEQLKAVDRAIEALATSDAAISTDLPSSRSEPTETEPPVVVVPPKRVLTDAHKSAMREGRRKARESKLLQARGLVPGEPAISAQSDPLPRLVKRSPVRTATVEPVGGRQEALVS